MRQSDMRVPCHSPFPTGIHPVEQSQPPPENPGAEAPRVSAISGSSSLVALRGKRLHLAGSYQNDGIWVGAYVDDEDLQLARRTGRKPSDS